MTSVSGSSGNGGGNSSGGNNGSGSPCGACKFLRRKCAPGCIFAPYFDSEQGTTHFAAVHKIFGASNVSKLLFTIPVHRRLDAVITICYEAQSRLRDPVYGCVAHIFALQQQVMSLQAELSYLHNHLTQLELPQPPPPPQPQSTAAPPVFSIADLPSVTAAVAAMPSTYELASLLDPLGHTSWAMDPRQYVGPATPSTAGVDIQAVARDLSRRHVNPRSPPASSGSKPSPSLSLSK